MDLSTRLLEAIDPIHRAGLKRIREGAAFALARRDRDAPQMKVQRDLGILPDLPVSARLFTPLGAPDVGPCIVFFHGGGFVLGGIDSHEALCRRLAAESGCRVVLATYRLAPENPWPAQFDDARIIVDHLLSDPSLGIDPAALALGGDSAGGYLAIALTRRLNAERPGAVKAQVLVYPLMHCEDGAWADTVFKDSRVVGRLAVRYINAQFNGAPPPSLLGADETLTPPTVITVGGALDPVRPDVIAYAAGLKAAGVPVEVFTHGLLPHGFGNLTHVSADARKAISEIGQAAARLLQ